MKKTEGCTNFSVPQSRPEIEKMKPYSAPLEGRNNLLRLDFNENTIGPSPKVLKAIKNINTNQISIYPEYNGLQKAVVDNLKASSLLNTLNSNQVGLFNGVDAAIHSIFYSYGEKGEKLVTAVPTFGYYHPCASMQGMEIIKIPYIGPDFSFPLEEISQSLATCNPKILIICNPNNPTGTNLPAKDILQLAQISPQTLVVIDELYEAFLGDSVLRVVDFNKMSNIVILRSLSKTYGLAGLRIGFAIGHSGIIDRISRVTGPYDINRFAVTGAFAALEDQAYVNNYINKVLRARLWIKEQLEQAQVKHHINAGNYFLIWPENNVIDVEESLKSQGILVRNMNGKALINGSIRVSIGTTSQMKRFWKAYKKADQIKALN